MTVSVKVFDTFVMGEAASGVGIRHRQEGRD
jgi:hypothetical protein